MTQKQSQQKRRVWHKKRQSLILWDEIVVAMHQPASLPPGTKHSAENASGGESNFSMEWRNGAEVKFKIFPNSKCQTQWRRQEEGIQQQPGTWRLIPRRLHHTERQGLLFHHTQTRGCQPTSIRPHKPVTRESDFTCKTRNIGISSNSLPSVTTVVNLATWWQIHAVLRIVDNVLA